MRIPCLSRSTDSKISKIEFYLTRVVPYSILLSSIRVLYRWSCVIFYLLGRDPPKISTFPPPVMTGYEGRKISFNYSIFSQSPTNINWIRSVGGHGVVKRTEWLPSNKEKSERRFTITNIEYPKDHNVSYTCNVSNNYGQTSRLFTLLVESKLI